MLSTDANSNELEIVCDKSGSIDEKDRKNSDDWGYTDGPCWSDGPYRLDGPYRSDGTCRSVGLLMVLLLLELRSLLHSASKAILYKSCHSRRRKLVCKTCFYNIVNCTLLKFDF